MTAPLMVMAKVMVTVKVMATTISVTGVSGHKNGNVIYVRIRTPRHNPNHEGDHGRAMALYW